MVKPQRTEAFKAKTGVSPRFNLRLHPGKEAGKAMVRNLIKRPQDKLGLGRLGERLAREYLEKQGLKTKASNYRCPQGEMDLIMDDGETLIFVEVRTRRGNRLGTPEESITFDKGKRLIQVAESYLQSENASDIHWRIDVVAVELDKNGRLKRIERIANAVTGDMEL